MKRSSKRFHLAKPLSVVCAVLLLGTVGYAKFHHPATNSQIHATQSAAKANADSKQVKEVVTPKPTAHTDAALQNIVDTWAGKQSANTSVVVRELTGDLRTAQHSSSVQMTTASTYKLYVAYATLHEVEQGTYTLDTTARNGQTVSAALSKMILQSDNNSAEALGFLVGWDRVNQLAASIGANRTDINNYNSAGQAVNGNKLSTTDDLATLVSQLQQGTLLNTSNTDLLLGLMKNQVWRQRIPAGIPSGIAVADKPGWLSNVQNDAGIVYGPKSTYVITIMTSGNSTKPLADLSGLIYNYLES